MLLFASLLVSAALSEYSALRASHEAHLSKSSRSVQLMHAHVTDALNRMRPMALQAATLQETYCLSAMGTFQAVWNSSCSVVGEVWNDTTTADRLNQVLDIYCVEVDANQLTCQQKVTWAFTQVFQNCSGLAIFDQKTIEDSRTLLTASAITCLRDDVNSSHFCIKDFISLRDLGENLTADKLNSACSACTEKVLIAFDTFAPMSLAQVSVYWKLICMEIGGKRCVLTFQEAINQPKTTGSPTDATLALVCDPCTIGFVARHVVTIAAFSGNVTEVEQEANFLLLTKYMCVKDWNNKFCFPQIFAANASFAMMGAKCKPDYAAHTCGAVCAGALNDLKKQLGCCFGTWFNFLDWQYVVDNANYMMPDTPTALRHYVGTTCQVPVPWGCGQQKIAVSLVLSNVKWSWYQANSAKVEQDLKNWLTYLLAIDASAIGAINIAQAANGKKVATPQGVGYHLLDNSASDQISIDTQVSPASSDQGQSVQSSVNNDAKSTPNAFANSWDLDSRADPSQPIFVASSVATPETSPAVTVTPAYFIAFLIASLLSLLLL